MKTMVGEAPAYTYFSCGVARAAAETSIAAPPTRPATHQRRAPMATSTCGPIAGICHASAYSPTFPHVRGTSRSEAEQPGVRDLNRVQIPFASDDAIPVGYHGARWSDVPW